MACGNFNNKYTDSCHTGCYIKKDFQNRLEGAFAEFLAAICHMHTHGVGEGNQMSPALYFIGINYLTIITAIMWGICYRKELWF